MKTRNTWKTIAVIGLISTILKTLILVLCALYIFISSYIVLTTVNSGFAALFVVLGWGVAFMALAVAAYYFIAGGTDYILSHKCVSPKKKHDIMVSRYVVYTFHTIGAVVECGIYLLMLIFFFDITIPEFGAIAMLCAFLLRFVLGIVDLASLIIAGRIKD